MAKIVNKILFAFFFAYGIGFGYLMTVATRSNDQDTFFLFAMCCLGCAMISALMEYKGVFEDY